MNASLICINLMNAIANKEIVNGHVHSIFHGACNIAAEREFVTLLSSGKIMAPMSAVIDDEEQVDFLRLGIKHGAVFSFGIDGICCREAGIFIGFENTRIWSADLITGSSDCTEEEVLENIRTMELGLFAYGKLYGAGPLAAMLGEKLPGFGEIQAQKAYSPERCYEFMRYRFLDFIQAFVNIDYERIAQAAEKVIGFGPGLTPAADDYISGMMIALLYAGHFYKVDTSRIYGFFSELIRTSLDKTTKVSSEMLKHSAAGKTNDAVRDLIRTILYQSDKRTILEALARVAGLGETSGSDMALGVYTGCKMMTDSTYRRRWLNESYSGHKGEQLF